MDEIIKKANELGHLLAKHEIVTRFRELSEQIHAAPESKELLEKVATVSQQLQIKEQMGQPIEVEEKKELESLQEKVGEDSLIKEFLATQHYYMTLLNQVNEVISNPKGEPPKDSNIIVPGQSEGGIVLP